MKVFCLQSEVLSRALRLTFASVAHNISSVNQWMKWRLFITAFTRAITPTNELQNRNWNRSLFFPLNDDDISDENHSLFFQINHLENSHWWILSVDFDCFFFRRWSEYENSCRIIEQLMYSKTDQFIWWAISQSYFHVFLHTFMRIDTIFTIVHRHTFVLLSIWTWTTQKKWREKI